MFDFIMVLALASLSVAALMEVVKTIINAINATLVRKKVGTGAESDFPIPSYVWWILGGLLSVAATILVWKSVVASDEPMTALLGIVTNAWFLAIWIPLVWWTQMQLDMKVIKAYAVPILKKVLAKKVGVEDA